MHKTKSKPDQNHKRLLHNNYYNILLLEHLSVSIFNKNTNIVLEAVHE